MAFRLTLKTDTASELRRIGAEQASKAVDALRDVNLSDSEKVHSVRRRCKKVRGLLRLVRPVLQGSYKVENARFRDTAQALSASRDAVTTSDALESLIKNTARRDVHGDLTSVRQALARQYAQRIDERGSMAALLCETEARLVSAKDHIVNWEVDADGADAVLPGFFQTYQRCRQEMHCAYEQPSIESFHRWRKRVKYHLFHCALLKSIWPAMLDARSAESRRLAKWLGEDHDLAVLIERIDDLRDEWKDDDPVNLLIAAADDRRDQLQSKSGRLGSLLFAESSRRFAKRWKRIWDAAT